MDKLPLGLLINPKNDMLVERLDVLEQYDFTGIDIIVSRKLLWKQEEIDRVRLEAKKFLSLALLDHEVGHVPKSDVDEYWHRMILQTRWYEKFCKDIFGFFIHHGPSVVPNPKQEELLASRTAKGMIHWYGSDWVGFRGMCCAGPVEWSPCDEHHRIDESLLKLVPDVSTRFV